MQGFKHAIDVSKCTNVERLNTKCDLVENAKCNITFVFKEITRATFQ